MYLYSPDIREDNIPLSRADFVTIKEHLKIAPIQQLCKYFVTCISAIAIRFS
ncbi:hypothetical protein IQ278_01845 [Tolypothrix sp. LEGE 11397]|uniref:hypothetical protein n=1 Tax=unclassified Tolypothrix TaxID=2649714 RepID=UPI0005EAAFF8|nr:MULTISPECIES: hypothetical protein [unclassified Tolypothrix]EKF04212.1 hypothetical protein FDUTEX481_01890 [Tolypothrix sp. PCC 7601]MBE9080903.1 hypothetical protein [Tolypothrix sp. LEGE 11397]UYD25337.1 hypothetical protein HGR01_28790 [Tolypothrix sp. PCC 7712]UYD32419.1 hypothetical protein HG267_25775 [Tolypothrix sp. PCC 7601]